MSQRPNLNELLCSEADFHNNIGRAKTTTRYKRRKLLPREMEGFDPLDPNNEFIEEVHVGRRCLLCCSNVILKYDSSTGGWYL